MVQNYATLRFIICRVPLPNSGVCFSKFSSFRLRVGKRSFIVIVCNIASTDLIIFSHFASLSVWNSFYFNAYKTIILTVILSHNVYKTTILSHNAYKVLFYLKMLIELSIYLKMLIQLSFRFIVCMKLSLRLYVTIISFQYVCSILISPN